MEQDETVSTSGGNGNARPHVRRKGSHKCALKTKAVVPHKRSETATTRATAAMTAAARQPTVTANELQAVFAGLKMRSVAPAERTQRSPDADADADTDDHLHGPAAWKAKFSRHRSAGDVLAKAAEAQVEKSVNRSVSAEPIGAAAKAPSRKPKPALSKKPVGLESAAANSARASDQDKTSSQGSVPKKPTVHPPHLKKPKVLEKPQKMLTKVDEKKTEGRKSLEIAPRLTVPKPNRGQTGSNNSSRSPSPTSPSPRRNKTSALKAVFESQAPEGANNSGGKPSFETPPGGRSGNRSPVVVRRRPQPVDDASHKAEREESEKSEQLAGHDINSKKSSYSSDSSAYDDVLLELGGDSAVTAGSAAGTTTVVTTAGTGASGRDGIAISLHDDDSGLGSTISADDAGLLAHTEGSSGGSAWSEWVDETVDLESTKITREKPKTPTPLSHRHSTADLHTKRPRRPKPRFLSNPERKVSSTGSYDDVELPLPGAQGGVDLAQGDENEWETDSEGSDTDRSTAFTTTTATGADRPPSMNGELPSAIITPPSPGMAVAAADAASVTPPPKPPRLPASGSPHLPARPPSSGVRTSPFGSPRGTSPTSRLAGGVSGGSSPRTSPKAGRRKCSLESTIPPPVLSLSRSREGSIHSDHSGSSVCSWSGGGEMRPDSPSIIYPPPPLPLATVGPAPPTIPPRRTQTEVFSKDAPALPARRKTSKDSTAPPLPPRDAPSATSKPLPIPAAAPVVGDDAPPPPPPPRQRVIVPAKDLKPNTVVPLSPEARNAGRREKEAQQRPRLPPRRVPSDKKRNNGGSPDHRLGRENCLPTPLDGSNDVADSHMLAEVPPPPPLRGRHRGDDYVGPDPPLPEAPEPPSSGYLDMGRSRPISNASSRDSYTDNYIDASEIESWPGQATNQTPAPFDDLWRTAPVSRPESSEVESDNYLTIMPDLERSSSNRFVDEPLYQIYHFGAVARDVLDQQRGDETDDDEDTYSGIGVMGPSEDDPADSGSATRIYETWERLARSRTRSPAEITTTLQSLVRTSTGVRTLWCEMPEVRECQIVSRMPLEQRKLQEALFEIITSEASYLKSLKLLISHFMENTELCSYVTSKRDRHILFSNIIAVHNVCESFMTELERIWQEDFMLTPALCNTVAKFAAGEFSVYVTYCSNLAYQERKLRMLKRDHPSFCEVLNELERSPQCHSLPLQSFLTMPMQRITRFPLLIDAVCNHLKPTHEDYPLVSNALHMLQKLVRQCNEGARQMENLEQIAGIDTKLEFRNLKKMAIVSHGRFLVKKGPLTHLRKEEKGLLIKKRKEQLYLFLFNDILIITKKKSDDHYQVLDYSSRIHCHAESVPLDQLARILPYGAPANASNVFVMALLENHQKQPTDFYFACESPSERMRWVEAVTPAQQVNDDERIYEVWACPQVQAIYRYVSTEPDELSLEEADIVNVTRKMADGWYEGERIRDGERGWFPANHTVEIHSERVRARNLLQRYRLLTLHTQSSSSSSTAASGVSASVTSGIMGPGVSAPGTSGGVVNIERSTVSSV